MKNSRVIAGTGKYSSAEGKREIITSDFLVVFFLGLFAGTMMQMINATLTLHIAELGHSTKISGILISAGSLASTIYRFFGGRLCESFGRRKMIIAGMLLYIPSILLLGRITVISIIFILMIFLMLGTAMASTALSIAVVDILPTKHVGEGIGYYSLSASLAQAFGPSIALWVYYSHSGFKSVSIVIALIAVISMIVAWSMLRYEKAGNGYYSVNRKEKKINHSQNGLWGFIEAKALPAASINFIVLLAGCITGMFLTLYADSIGIVNAGLFFTISVVIMVVARVVSGTISDRYGALAVVLPGCIAMAACFFCLLLSQSFSYLYYVAGALNGVGLGLITPALNAEAVRNVPQERKSIASSTFYVPTDLAYVIGAILWGNVIARSGYKVLFIAASGLECAALIIAILVLRNKHESSKTVGIRSSDADAGRRFRRRV